MEKYLKFAKEMAIDAGNIMKKYYRKDNISSYKKDNTIVTIADKEINNLLIKRVKKLFPTHSVDGEEQSFGLSDYVWVCDPIDGTAMYKRGIATSVFSLALVIEGTVYLGVVYDPFHDDLYWALKNNGAYLNDKKIKVNSYNLDDKESIIHFDMWKDAEYNIMPIVSKLVNKSYIVSIGSIIRASMAVATGDFTLALYPGTIHKNQDIAALSLIVAEAGGKVTNLFGQDQRYDTSIKGAIISNGIVHEEVLNTVLDILKERS